VWKAGVLDSIKQENYALDRLYQRDPLKAGVDQNPNFTLLSIDYEQHSTFNLYLFESLGIKNDKSGQRLILLMLLTKTLMVKWQKRFEYSETNHLYSQDESLLSLDRNCESGAFRVEFEIHQLLLVLDWSNSSYSKKKVLGLLSDLFKESLGNEILLEHLLMSLKGVLAKSVK
jgi:hypothetical protein